MDAGEGGLWVRSKWIQCRCQEKSLLGLECCRSQRGVVLCGLADRGKTSPSSLGLYTTTKAVASRVETRADKESRQLSETLGFSKRSEQKQKGEAS